jgi:hypothetical protein
MSLDHSLRLLLTLLMDGFGTASSGCSLWSGGRRPTPARGGPRPAPVAVATLLRAVADLLDGGQER